MRLMEIECKRAQKGCKRSSVGGNTVCEYNVNVLRLMETPYVVRV